MFTLSNSLIGVIFGGKVVLYFRLDIKYSMIPESDIDIQRKLSICGHFLNIKVVQWSDSDSDITTNGN